jgi:hypothetical protein
MLAAKSILLDNPEIDHIDSAKIAEMTSIPEKEVGLALKLASEYGHFFSSASGSNEYNGFSRMDLSSNENIFDHYLAFSSIEELVNMYYLEEEEQEQLNKENQQTNAYNTETQKSNHSLKINPIFKSVITHIDPKLCFVLMPFKKSWSNMVYIRYLRENIESLGLQCIKADELKGQIIIEDIWTKINQAAFLIADVTDKNPNVMYELGIAHTIGKPTILITQEIETIPFDFNYLRHHPYKTDFEDKERFDIEIKKAINELYKEHYPNISLSKAQSEKPKPTKTSKAKKISGRKKI